MTPSSVSAPLLAALQVNLLSWVSVPATRSPALLVQSKSLFPDAPCSQWPLLPESQPCLKFTGLLDIVLRGCRDLSVMLWPCMALQWPTLQSLICGQSICGTSR